jgi:hypothetical protein
MQGLRATHRGSHRFQHHGVPPAGPPKQRSSAADYGFAGEKGGSVEGWPKTRHWVIHPKMGKICFNKFIEF